MEKKEPQLDLVEAMANIEELISRHYEACASKFNEHRDFWNKLSLEEIEHAQWIRQLKAESDKGLLSLDEKRFNKESVLEFRNRLKDMLSSFQAQAKSMREALTNGISIENNILERKFFEVFTSDSPKLKELFKRLEEATKDHRQRITQLLAQTK